MSLSEQSARPAENLEPREISKQEVSDMLFWSFYFSQGRSELQNDFVHLAGQNHPEMLLPNDDTFILPDLQRYKKFLEPGATHTRLIPQESASDLIRAIQEEHGLSIADAHIYNQIHVHWKVAQNAFSGLRPDPIEIQDLLQKITTHMIWRDAQYARKPELRPAAETRPKEGPFAANKSHFVSYVLRHETVPGPAIYTEIMEQIRNSLSDESLVNKLPESAITSLASILPSDADLADHPLLKKRAAELIDWPKEAIAETE